MDANKVLQKFYSLVQKYGYTDMWTDDLCIIYEKLILPTPNNHGYVIKEGFVGFWQNFPDDLIRNIEDESCMICIAGVGTDKFKISAISDVYNGPLLSLDAIPLL